MRRLDVVLVSGAVLLAAVATVLVIAATRSGPDNEDAVGKFVKFGTVDVDPDWSPDGRLIAFATNRGSGGVFVVRPDGTGIRRLLAGEASDVDWSPDGKAIAFTGGDGIYVFDLASRERRRVVRGGAYSLPAWAPDGDELAVVRDVPGVFPTYDGSIESSSPAIYVVRLDGTGLRRLLPRYRGSVGGASPGSVAAVSETDPAWSPDGTRIAFQAGDGEIVSADVNDGSRVDINRASAGYETTWSPDGRLIAYQCEGDVCVANADGSGNEHRVASGGGDPSFSPDSRLIVFERYLYGGPSWGSEPRSLSVVEANGNELRVLTYGPSRGVSR